MSDILTVLEHDRIYIGQKRDVSAKTISDDDAKLLLKITYKTRSKKDIKVFSFNGDHIKTNSIVGSISLKNGLIIEILPKFAKSDLDEQSIKKYRKTLLNMIKVSKEKNFISSTIQSSKVSMGEMPLIRYMIELFSESLLFEFRHSSFSHYRKTVENSNYVRGNILVSKTIQNNIFDKSKVYISYNKHSKNNLLMQIFRTISKLLLNDTNLSYRAKQNLYEIYILLDDIQIINLKQEDFSKIVFNRLNSKFENLFRQAEFIFKQYMPFTSNINSAPFWAILFNMDFLFEKFCAYIFNTSNLIFSEQSKISCYTDEVETLKIKPDFILYEESKYVGVIEAKWKLLKKGSMLYGLTNSDFYQLFSYMNLLSESDDKLQGYFIVPKHDSSIKNEISFKHIDSKFAKITILSIDFSLEFEELIDKYKFALIDKQLKIVDEVGKEEIFEKDLNIDSNDEKFNLKNFIEELQILRDDKDIRSKLSARKKDEKFKNLFYIKDFYKLSNNKFKEIKRDNLSNPTWNFSNLDIDSIPSSINRLKETKYLDLSNNSINELPEEFFQLKKMVQLNLSNNPIKYLPIKTLEFRNLNRLIVDRDMVENNIEILKKMIENGVEILDENSIFLSEDINKTFDKNGKIEITNFNINVNNLEQNNIVNLENYSKLTDNEKIEFSAQADIKNSDFNLIKMLCYEKNENILVKILRNETTPIRFILLIYILNFKDREFKNRYLFEEIQKREDSDLNKVVGFSESGNLQEVSEYIKNSFSTINDEIFFGYAMSNIKGVLPIRRVISEYTEELNIMNELSKNRDDEPVLRNIIYKNSESKSFREKINSRDSLYTTEILDRIARYKEYYSFEDKKCLITQLARNYCLSEETREYLFNEYKSDKVVLKQLNNESLYRFPKLKNKIESLLNPFNSITF